MDHKKAANRAKELLAKIVKDSSPIYSHEDGSNLRHSFLRDGRHELEPEGLEKGFKELAAAAAIALTPTAHVAPENISSRAPAVRQHAITHTQLHPDLQHISMIESSGGKNKNHKMTNVGLNAGHTAGGSTGLMPLMAQETINKNPALKAKYGHLSTAPHEQVTHEMNTNPDMEAEIANAHWHRLGKVFKGERSRMAFAWRNGITKAKQAKPDEVYAHPYVQKFLHESAKGKMAMQKSELAKGKAAQKFWDNRKFNKSENDLTKMSRPSVTFPHFKKLNTRPDQEIQTIETGRQKEMFGRKIANAETKDAKNVPHTEMVRHPDGRLEVKSQTTKDVSHQPRREKAAKQIAVQFGRNVLGLNSSTKDGPKSGAIAGKLRSKFEAGDDEHQAKIKEHHEKSAGIVIAHNDKVAVWRSKEYELSNKVHEPGGAEAYQAHVATRPAKPKLPRKPSKPRTATADLSPEKQKARGQAVDATIHHEAFHHTMADMERRYGKDVAGKAHRGMLSQFHPDTLQSVGGFISTKMVYKPRSAKFTEEILAHSRDILTNPKKRAAYKEYAGDKADEHIKNIKRGHQKAYDYAQKLKPSDLGFGHDEVKKIAMIGHGALGAPTSLTGAAALLSESMGKVKKKVKKLKDDSMAKAISDLEDAENILGKSNYGPKQAALYNPADNARRKSKRQTEEVDAAGPNKAVHITSVSAKVQADQSAKEAKKKSRKQPIRIYSDDEKAKLQSELKQKRPTWVLKLESKKSKR